MAVRTENPFENDGHLRLQQLSTKCIHMHAFIIFYGLGFRRGVLYYMKKRVSPEGESLSLELCLHYYLLTGNISAVGGLLKCAVTSLRE